MDSTDTPTILVVDDDILLIDALVSVIKSNSSFDAISASNGLEGLALAKNFRPHMVVLDLVMPEMDGFEFIRTLRSEVWGREQKVIVLTGDASAHITEQLSEHNVFGILDKGTYSLEDVAHKILELASQ